MKILVESKYTKRVLKALGLAQVALTRGHGKEDVIRRIIGCEGKVGVVDADPEQDEPRSLKKFRNIKEYPEEDPEIKMMRGEGKFLVLVFPRFREWVVYTLTTRYGKSPQDFRLPNEPNELKKVVEKVGGKGALVECAKWLVEKEEAEELQTLIKWLTPCANQACS